MGNFRQVIQTKKEKAGGGRRIETLVAHIFFQKLLFFCSAVLYSTVHGTVNAQSYKPN